MVAEWECDFSQKRKMVEVVVVLFECCDTIPHMRTPTSIASERAVRAASVSIVNELSETVESRQSVTWRIWEGTAVSCTRTLYKTSELCYTCKGEGGKTSVCVPHQKHSWYQWALPAVTSRFHFMHSSGNRNKTSLGFHSRVWHISNQTWKTAKYCGYSTSISLYHYILIVFLYLYNTYKNIYCYHCYHFLEKYIIRIGAIFFSPSKI